MPVSLIQYLLDQGCVMHKSIRVTLAVVALLLSSEAMPGNLLSIDKGPGADELILDWSGPGPAWVVYAAATAESVRDPSNELGQTFDPWWSMTASTDPLEFILVDSRCRAGFPELCDGFDNDCDGDVDEIFKDPSGQHYVHRLHCGACGQSCESVYGDCLLFPDCTGADVPTCTSFGNPCIGPLCDEACDYVDNNEDCEIDEDFKDPTGEAYVHDEACGACGVPCDTVWLPGTRCHLVEDCNEQPYPACTSAGTCIGAGCPEECDRIDNDLDCIVDNGFVDGGGEYVTDANCGNCGNDCSLMEFEGRPGVCVWEPWWVDAGWRSRPTCSVDCVGNCFDVDGNPNTGCECCDPVPSEGCGDPLMVDSDCDGPDPFDSDCIAWPRPEPYAEEDVVQTGPPFTTLIGCDGTPGSGREPIVLYELDVDGDLVFDHSSVEPIFLEHTFTVSGTHRIHCRVTDSAARSMPWYHQVTLN